MRPVNNVPSGRKLKRHGDAKPSLIHAMGEYCAYCERQVDAVNLDVEHIKPQKTHDKLSLTWANFLLACKSCNTYKRHYQGATRQPSILSKQAWPHLDNTYAAYDYDQHGRVTVAAVLATPAQRDMATHTLHMAGLDQTPAVNVAYTRLSLIYDITSKRERAWQVATLALAAYVQNPTDIQRLSILNQAEAVGFFSIWMRIFSAHPPIKQSLIVRFKACSTCFDLNGDPLSPRGPGRI